MKISNMLGFITVILVANFGAFAQTNNSLMTGSPALLATSGSSLKQAQGGIATGGGSGCLSDFMYAAGNVGKWLSANGSSLNPRISAQAFLRAIEPNLIKLTTEDLQYHGNPTDAYFDGQVIKLRCDRLQATDPAGRERVVAHEIFRKMGVEGDAYEVSRQIPILTTLNTNGSVNITGEGAITLDDIVRLSTVEINPVMDGYSIAATDGSYSVHDGSIYYGPSYAQQIAFALCQRYGFDRAQSVQSAEIAVTAAAKKSFQKVPLLFLEKNGELVLKTFVLGQKHPEYKSKFEIPQVLTKIRCQKNSLRPNGATHAQTPN